VTPPDGDGDGDRDRAGDAGDGGPQELLLEFEYDDERLAEVIERSVRREVGEIDGDRSTASLTREGRTLRLAVLAEDLVALRAGLNSWCTLLEVAERAAEP
jgi:KEOPS complex subunit Pcc1